MNFFDKIKFKMNQKAPEILLVAGIGGIVVSTIGYIKQTPKAMEVINKAKSDRKTIDDVATQCIEDPEYAKEIGYSVEENYKRDCMIVKSQMVWGLIKVYAIPAAIQAASIFCLLKSHTVLKGRHIATAATLASVMKEFKDYRNRVVDKYGEETDYKLRYGIEEETVDDVIIDENGKEKKVKKKVDIVTTERGEYTYFFDSTSSAWSKDPELNKMTLMGLEKEFNSLLIRRGYVFLNEILRKLDLPETQAGMVVGWRYDPDRPAGSGDNYISFGVFNSANEANRRFVNGLESVCMLDFNCDGYLLDGSLDGIMPQGYSTY